MIDTPSPTLRSVRIDRDFASWRSAARTLLATDVPPDQILWNDQAHTDALPGIADAADRFAPPRRTAPRVPREFIPLARTVACMRDPTRWSLLYRTLWRLTHGEPNLLRITVDDDVLQLTHMEKAVRRDAHKMRAFVRFRKVDTEDGDHYIAFHRPDHYIVKSVAPWFAGRFGTMRWTILTPDDTASFDGHQLLFGPGAAASAAPTDDAIEELWKTYYANIFNPARVKVHAMQAEMPKKHWSTLPETELIPQLLREAPKRVEAMMKKSKASADACESTGSAADFVPHSLDLPVLAKAAAGCRGCDIYCNATQVVFGQGPATASVMFIGEQPGDQEDRAGTPFVGPSGQLLNGALEQVGIDRSEVYVTNAVKHFKFEPRGTRRIHAKPNARETTACRPWLEAEIASVRPKLIVCLGATAAQSLMGRDFRLTVSRGRVIADTRWAPAVIATNHPSALLRMPDPQAREAAYEMFLSDLRLVDQQMNKITREQANESAKHVQVGTA